MIVIRNKISNQYRAQKDSEMPQATATKKNKSVQNQTNLLPKAVKKVLLNGQAKLREDAPISNKLNRLLDANSDCV